MGDKVVFRDIKGVPHYERKPTNADRIRSMSDEELAEHLYWWDNSPLHASLERWLDWLKQEATE